MALAIYKYPLKVEVKQDVFMPKGAKVLSLQMQNDVPTLWALVDPSDLVQNVRRVVWLIPTGEKLRYEDQLKTFAQMDFVGTVQDGSYAGHFFIDRE